MVMPPLLPLVDTQKLLDMWGMKSQDYQRKLMDSSKQLDVLRNKMVTLRPVVSETPTFAEQMFAKPFPTEWVYEFPAIEDKPHTNKELQAQIAIVAGDFKRFEFYARLYSYIPTTILGGQVNSVDEALAVVAPPSGLTSEEMNNVREAVQSMLTNLVRAEPDETTEGMFTQPVGEPSLVAPTRAPGLVPPSGIQKLTVDAIVQYLSIPEGPPDPVLSDSEWQELLNKTYPEYADMTQVEIMEAEAKRIIAESKLANEKMAGFDDAMAEMPSYKLADFFRESILQPGLAMLEVANKYFENVSQPIAASVYKTFIPGLEDMYQQYRLTEDSDWQALSKAWENWDAPGGGVAEFLLKYMIMENITDPLNWLSVFSLGTSMVASTTGKFARFALMVNKANRIFNAPFEAPFNAIKWTVGQIPKTISQRAAIVESRTGAIVRQYMETVAGKGKFINKGMTMKDWTKAANNAIRYAFNNPQSIDPIAEVGHALLKYEPMTKKDLVRYAGRLGLTLTEDDITSSMLANVNTIFNAVFSKYGARTGKLMTSKEGAKRFLDVLGLGGSDAKINNRAVTILEGKANRIIKDAKSFSELKSPGEAMRALMKRNFDYHINIERSKQAMDLARSGKFNQLYAGVEAKFLSVWSKYVEDIIIRPTAQAYLTFGMYGPMNIIEDHWRSILGGVFPRRMSTEHAQILFRGLAVHPDMLDPRLSVSEAYGKLMRRGSDEQFNNWILQLSMLGNKEWADKLYSGLVRLPGGFGMDIRRNFVGQKYLTLFKEMGGDTVEMLLKVDAPLPNLADKKLIREIKSAVNDAKTTLDVDTIRSVKNMFTRKIIYRKEVDSLLMEHPGLHNVFRDHILQSFDDDTLYINGIKSTNLKMKEATQKLLDNYVKSAEYATKQFQELTEMLAGFEVKNPEEVAHLLYNVNHAAAIYGKAPEEILAAATVASQGKSLVERRVYFDKIYSDVMEFQEKAGVNLEKLVDKIRVDLKTPSSTFGPEHVTKTNRLLDLLIAKKSLSDQFRLEDMAWRADHFADVSSKEMTDEWWTKTYKLMRDRINNNNVKLVGIEGDIFSALREVDVAAGIQPFTRQPIKVKGRLLTPQDVANLIGCQGDDLSRALLDNLTIVNNRAMFVEYVSRQVRAGDIGFNKVSIGKVFDQITRQARIKPDTLSWLSSKKLEIESVRGELHSLYHSKLLPDNEVAEITRYVDAVADGVVNLIHTDVGVKIIATKPVGVGQFTEFTITKEGKNIGAVLTDNLHPTSSSSLTITEIDISGGLNREMLGDILDKMTTQARIVKKRYLDVIPKPTHTKIYESVGFKKVIDAHHPDGFFRLSVGKEKPVQRILKPEFVNLQTIRQEALDEANKWYFKEFTDYTNANAFDAIMKGIFPFWCVPEYATILTRTGWKEYPKLQIGEDVLVVDSKTLVTRWEPVQDIAEFDYDDDLMVIPAKGKDIEFTPNHRWLVINRHQSAPDIRRGYQLNGNHLIPRALKHDFPVNSILTPRDAAILGWVMTDGYVNRPIGRKPRLVIYQSINKYLGEIQELTGMKGNLREPTGHSPSDSLNFTICVKQVDADRILSVCPDKSYLPQIVSMLDKTSAQSMWDAMFKAEGSTHIEYTGMENKSFKQNPGPVMQAFQLLSVLLGKAITANDRRVNILANHKPYYAKEVRRLTTKHYKGKIWCPITSSGTWFMNCNGSIVPTGNTYESQRWFWLPRSFIRNPGTFTAMERWQDNTDNGYIHIPGTSIEYQPFRGTVYGPLTTRLTKRDYPEYYDAWEGAESVTGYIDWMSRYGFYLGAHLTIPMSLFGGLETQAGETLPPVWETPLMLTQLAFPKSDAVKVLTDHVFSDRFRTYMTVQEVVALGGDGAVISAKLQRGEALTVEEQALWDQARRSTAAYSLLFEQTGVFRLRSEEKLKVYDAVTKYIEERYGYTDDQQKWLRMHGYRIWDQVGGVSLDDQRFLEEINYWQYSAGSDRLLPGRQQLVADELTLAWNDVEQFVDNTLTRKDDLERKFRLGEIGPRDYQDGLTGLYAEQSNFIYTKSKELLDVPLPSGLSEEEEKKFVDEHSIMELQGRKAYYQREGIPLPVLHPLRELMNLYYSIDVKEIKDPETGDMVMDWDTFFAQRKAIEEAIPDMWKAEFIEAIHKNETTLETVRRQVHEAYFNKYWWVYDQVLKGYSDYERGLIKEYLSLSERGVNLQRQAEIRATRSERTGNLLISGFQSDVSGARIALRYANPVLDAWLFYWGRTSSFQTPEAEQIYYRLASETGRSI